MSRTALEICQHAANKIGLEPPGMLFASTDQDAIELRLMLVEAADYIARSHDWQVLKVDASHIGDGTTTRFTLPSDFMRFPKDASILSTSDNRPIRRVDPQEWMISDISDVGGAVCIWTIIGDEVVYHPALGIGENGRFFYVSANYARSSGGTPKARFSGDDDTFRLDDRVLELTTIWKWREYKGLDYAEDLRNAALAMQQEIGQDKGPRVLTQRGRSRIAAPYAFPGTING